MTGKKDPGPSAFQRPALFGHCVWSYPIPQKVRSIGGFLRV